MTRINLCLLVLLQSLLLTSCMKTPVNEPQRPQQLAIVALHDLTQMVPTAADCQCTQIKFDVEMKVGLENLKNDLGLDEGTASLLIDFIESKAHSLNALVCSFDSSSDNKKIRSKVHRLLTQSAKGDWINICSPAPNGGEDCTYCEEDENGKLKCWDYHLPPYEGDTNRDSR